MSVAIGVERVTLVLEYLCGCCIVSIGSIGAVGRAATPSSGFSKQRKGNSGTSAMVSWGLRLRLAQTATEVFTQRERSESLKSRLKYFLLGGASMTSTVSLQLAKISHPALASSPLVSCPDLADK